MKEESLFDFEDLSLCLLDRLDIQALQEWMFIQVFEYGVLVLHEVPELEKLWMLARLKSMNLIKAKTFAQVFEKVDKNKKCCRSASKKLQLKQTLLILSDLAFHQVSLASLQALCLIRSMTQKRKFDLPSDCFFYKLEQTAVLADLLKLENQLTQK